jgi:hypothetical protein
MEKAKRSDIARRGQNVKVNLPFFEITWLLQNKVGDFFNFMWPYQNI